MGLVLFMNKEGYDACYKVKCLDSSICLRWAVTDIITNECLGCPSDQTHFNLSGAAFGHMAIVGKGSQLSDYGQIPIIYWRIVLSQTYYPKPQKIFIIILIKYSAYFLFQLSSLFFFNSSIHHNFFNFYFFFRKLVTYSKSALPRPISLIYEK